LELGGEVEQPHLALFFRKDLVKEGEVVAEKKDRCGIVDLGVFADEVLEKDGRHGRDVLVAESQVGAGEAGVAGLDAGDADVAMLVDHVAGEDFFRQRHGAFGRGYSRQKYFFLHAGDVEGEQAAVLDDLARDLVFARGEFGERDFLAGANLVDEREVGRSENAEVLAVLLVDALDVFRDDELDAGGALGVRRLLTAGTFAATLAADGGDEPALLHVSALDGEFGAALQAGVGELAQGFVEEEADVRGRDLVGGDVVAQLGIGGRIFRVPGEVLAGQLAADERGIFGEEQDAALEADLGGSLDDFAGEERRYHNVILAGRRRWSS